MQLEIFHKGTEKREKEGEGKRERENWGQVRYRTAGRGMRRNGSK